MPRGNDTSRNSKRKIIKMDNVYYVNFRDPKKLHPYIEQYALQVQKEARERAAHPSVTEKPFDWNKDPELKKDED